MASEILVLVSAPAGESEQLAKTLVEERLAACVNIMPNVRSVYSWEGKICNETEELLVIKTNRSMWDALRERVEQLHSYDVPEIISLPIEDGHKPYLDWLNACVRAGT
jgi:periplasmic divalent cation tolerance protein